MRNGLQFLLFSALLHITFSLHQFVWVPHYKTWPEAQTFCRQYYTDLATIDDQQDLDQLTITIGAATGPIWIGLYRTSSTGDFVWSDQSSSSFRNWKSGAPGSGLSVAVEGGTWYDRNNGDPLHFVCYFGNQIITVPQTQMTTVPQTDITTDPQTDITTVPQTDITTDPQTDITTVPQTDIITVPPKRQMVKLEVKSSEDLNDPKVKNKILLKMEQILKEKGLAGDAKLSWRIQSDGNVFQKKDQKRKATQQICVP